MSLTVCFCFFGEYGRGVGDPADLGWLAAAAEVNKHGVYPRDADPF